MLYQTYSGWEHLRLLDQERNGCAATMNILAEQARGDWILPLADDDLLLPGGLETLVKATKDADIVYAPPLVWGLDNPHWFFGEPPCIPSFALVRADMWRQLGGYDYDWHREEDRRLWERAMAAGARFVRVSDAPTWIYRIHGGNKSFNDGQAS